MNVCHITVHRLRRPDPFSKTRNTRNTNNAQAEDERVGTGIVAVAQIDQALPETVSVKVGHE